MITLNIGAILLASVATFLFGWLWYSPILFLKPWQQLANIPASKPKAWTMLAGLCSYAVLAGVMDVLFQIIGVGSLVVALKMALLFWLGFVATLTLGLVTWEQKSWKLYLIHNGYHIASFLIVSAIVFGLR